MAESIINGVATKLSRFVTPDVKHILSALMSERLQVLALNRMQRCSFDGVLSIRHRPTSVNFTEYWTELLPFLNTPISGSAKFTAYLIELLEL